MAGTLSLQSATCYAADVFSILKKKKMNKMEKEEFDQEESVWSSADVCHPPLEVYLGNGTETYERIQEEIQKKKTWKKKKFKIKVKLSVCR